LGCDGTRVDELARHVDRLFTDEKSIEPAKELVGLVGEGVISYKIVKGNNEVLIVVSPGEQVAGAMEQGLGMVQMMGFGDMIDQNITQANISVKSVNDFNYIEENFEKDGIFAALARSLEIEADLIFNPSMVEQLITTLSAMLPFMGKAAALTAFLSIGLNLRFDNLDSLPDGIKKHIKENPLQQAGGIALPKEIQNWERPFLRDFIDMVTKFEFLGCVKDIGYANIRANVPGFGNHFGRHIQKDKGQDD